MCNYCCLDGVTPDRAREIAPNYMAALDALTDDGSVPDEPSDACWDCRRLLRAGIDPRNY